MNFIAIIVFNLLTISLNQILCELIFEDYFNELDSNKWTIIGEKAKCSEYFEYQGNFQLSCSTNNKINLRTIFGKLALTGVNERYFESNFTTATIVSKLGFPLNEKSPSLLFRIRAALPTFKGLVPKIFLLAQYNIDAIKLFITMLSFDETLWYDQAKNLDITKATKNINFNEFQDYEMLFDQETFTWRLNGKDVFQKDASYSSYPNRYFTYQPKGVDYEYYLVITMHVDTERFQPWKESHDLKPCHSFLIDHVKVYHYNSSQEYPPEAEQYSNENSNDICKNIIDLNDQAYVKFIPENYTTLIYNDEFDESSLDENKWINKANESRCHYDYYYGKQSCDALGDSNIVVKDGKLQLFVRMESYLEQNFTGVTIATKECFKKGRFEIKAKRPRESGVSTRIFMETNHQGCNQGLVIGRLGIIEMSGGQDTFQTSWQPLLWPNKAIQMPGSKGKAFNEDLDDYQVYGIEWTSSVIQWFINDRVIYQANRKGDQNGEKLPGEDERKYLPFDNAFNLLIHVGVDKNYQGQTWNSPVLEIDYVRVYDDSPPKFVPQINEQGSNLISNPLIIGMSLVMIILVALVAIVVYLWKRVKFNDNQVENNETYDDVFDKDNVYEDPNYQVYNEYEIPDSRYENIHDKAKVGSKHAQESEMNEYLEIKA